MLGDYDWYVFGGVWYNCGFVFDYFEEWYFCFWGLIYYNGFSVVVENCECYDVI